MRDFFNRLFGRRIDLRRRSRNVQRIDTREYLREAYRRAPGGGIRRVKI